MTDWWNLERPYQWIGQRLGQLGIDVRQSGQRKRMRIYIALLKEQIAATEEFLADDQSTRKET